MIKSSTIEDGAPNYILEPFISQVLTYQASTVLIFVFDSTFFPSSSSSLFSILVYHLINKVNDKMLHIKSMLQVRAKCY